MTLAQEWRERSINQMRRTIGWDVSVVYDPYVSSPLDEDESLSAEDREDLRDARARLADPAMSTISLEDLKKELGF
jgi:hypothetical protein